MFAVRKKVVPRRIIYSQYNVWTIHQCNHYTLIFIFMHLLKISIYISHAFMQQAVETGIYAVQIFVGTVKRNYFQIRP